MTDHSLPESIWNVIIHETLRLLRQIFCMLTNTTRLWLGELNSIELPTTIELGKVGQILDKMYKDSAQDLRERAAVLFLNQTGHLCTSKPIMGDRYRVIIHRPKLDAGEQYVGIMHTHPPLMGTGVAFGGQDFVVMVNSNDVIALLQTGSNLVALIRTEKTATKANVDTVRSQMRAVEQQATSQGMTAKEGLVLANLAICQTYGLALYVGYAPGPLEEIFRP